MKPTTPTWAELSHAALSKRGLACRSDCPVCKAERERAKAAAGS